MINQFAHAETSFSSYSSDKPKSKSQTDTNEYENTNLNTSISNVLIVEDCASTRLVMCHYSNLQNFRTWAATSGENALYLAAHHGFDLVFLDISLPGIDGLETLSRMMPLKSDGSLTQFIICSAYPMPEICDEKPCFHFLPKPVSRYQFNSLVDHLDIHRQHENSFSTNKAVLNDIFCDMDDHLKRQVYAEFHNDIDRHLSNLLVANFQKNLTAFEQALHALRGLSSTFGLTGLLSLLKLANEMANNAMQESAFSLTGEIEKCAKACLKTVHDRLHQD